MIKTKILLIKIEIRNKNTTNKDRNKIEKGRNTTNKGRNKIELKILLIQTKIR